MRKRKNREVKCLACCHTARKQQRWGLDIGRLALKHLYELPLDSLVVQWSLCMLFRTNLAPDSHPNSQKDLSKTSRSLSALVGLPCGCPLLAPLSGTPLPISLALLPVFANQDHTLPVESRQQIPPPSTLRPPQTAEPVQCEKGGYLPEVSGKHPEVTPGWLKSVGP